MKRVKVYLKGAYAPGNLGDDILLLCMLNILKQYFKPSEIYVGLDKPILGNKIDKEIMWISSKEVVFADLAIYGGGGQFFSFDKKYKKSKKSKKNVLWFMSDLKNSILRQNGFYDAFLRVVFKIVGSNTVFKANRLAAFCVGVGPLEGDNNKISKMLNALNYISVRDETSKILCEDLDVRVSGCYTDPSLMSRLWWDNKLSNEESSCEYYSFVVRDWPYTEHGENKIDLLIKTAMHLKNLGCKVRIVSLFADRDSHLKKKCIGLEWFEWDINNKLMSDFINKFIYDSKVIVSSRAHGVLLPASLGIPSIAVPIENKLVEVASMLSGGVFLSTASSVEDMCKEILLFQNDLTAYREHLNKIINKRSLEVSSAINSFDDWIRGEGISPLDN